MAPSSFRPSRMTPAPDLSGGASASDLPPRPRPDPERGGFALVVVVFLLFAIGIAGATGYQMVRWEANLATSSEEGARAFSMAQAGLQRYFGEQAGGPPQERTFEFDDGEAVVTPRKTQEVSATSHHYLLTSEATHFDPRRPDLGARRTVRQYAVYRRLPLELQGAFVSTATTVTLDNQVRIDGRDDAHPQACPESRMDALAGVVGAGVIIAPGPSAQGSPSTASYGSPQAVRDSLAARWDVLTDEDFPVEYDGTWPNFASLPADEYPVVRHWGNLNAQENRSGRGVLIVTGRLQPRDGFQWDGIVISGNFQPVTNNQEFEIRGLLAAGLGTDLGSISIQGGGEVRFHSCNVLAAGSELAYFAPLANTWWEGF